MCDHVQQPRPSHLASPSLQIITSPPSPDNLLSKDSDEPRITVQRDRSCAGKQQPAKSNVIDPRCTTDTLVSPRRQNRNGVCVTASSDLPCTSQQIHHTTVVMFQGGFGLQAHSLVFLQSIPPVAGQRSPATSDLSEDKAILALS